MDLVLYILLPCYNEEKVLPESSRLFIAKLQELIKAGNISDKSRIVFVDDGSKDNTWHIIKSLKEKYSFCQGIRLSRNYGHQNALMAGMMSIKDNCDVCITLDCDGQDDIDAIDQMLTEYNSGCDIVYGVRNQRKKDKFLKRVTAGGFYKFMNILGAETIDNHADYRLLSKKALYALSEFKEVNLFLRGMVPLIGLRSTAVYYERKERIAGDTHYSLAKMFSLAIDGITSFSVKPLRFISTMGIIIFILSLVMILVTFIRHFMGATVIGWSSTVCILLFIGGLILLSLGIIGEYIGRIYSEVKRRPLYIISEKTDEKSKKP